ncbi:nonstructural protein [Penshurt virus]|uniref:Nonstructural protein n=1 Tax=Penshurt virus TaxID=2721854 RepID=A0A6M4AMI4_9VIRU|nr:nonstructural protein [Penshurt virus]QJQ29394.1 nonstructural protein [Penshurt virus]
MLNYYLFDRPVVKRADKKRVVYYMAHNNYVSKPVACYYGLEFIIDHFKPEPTSCLDFHVFYERGYLPTLIQSEGPSQVRSSAPPPDGIFEFISDFSVDLFETFEEEFMIEAVRWPTGKPSLQFFQHWRNRSPGYNWLSKSMIASELLTATTEMCLCCAFPRMHGFIRNIARRMDLDLKLFPGGDIVTEICHIQCVKMMKAALIERAEDKPLSPVTELILTAMGEFTKESDPKLKEMMEGATSYLDSALK